MAVKPAAPAAYRPVAAAIGQTVQPSTAQRFAVSAVIQRVGVRTVNVNALFTQNHVAATPQAALASYIRQGRNVPTTYIMRAPQNGDIVQTRDRTGRGRGLSDQVADFPVDRSFKVSGGGGSFYRVSRYVGTDVVVKGNAQPEPVGRGFIFHVTGVDNSTRDGTREITWEYQNGPAQPPSVVYADISLTRIPVPPPPPQQQPVLVQAPQQPIVVPPPQPVAVQLPQPQLPQVVAVQPPPQIQQPVLTPPQPQGLPQPITVPQNLPQPPRQIIAPPRPRTPLPTPPPRQGLPQQVPPSSQGGGASSYLSSLWNYAPAIGLAAGYVALSYFGGTVMAKRSVGPRPHFPPPAPRAGSRRP